MAKENTTSSSDLFIVDNSDNDWKVKNYLHEWADIANKFDVATGYFEIGALLALDGQWQKLEKLRILMGGEVSRRTKKALLAGVESIKKTLDNSIETEKESNDFLHGVPAIVEALRNKQIECCVYNKEKFHAKAYITHAKPDFFFTAKLHKDFTHEGKIDPETVKQFHSGFEPLLEAGKLKQLLVQFRYDFADNKDNRQHLTKIITSFSDAFDLTVEVRHKSWESPQALEYLEQLGVTVCNLDYPTSRNSFDLQQCIIGKTGYLRMHGRNVDKWFSKAGRDETYDYYYNDKELAQIKTRIDQLAQAYNFLIVIANNHYRGAELANALELKCLLTGSKQSVPEGLLQTYPKLAYVASNKSLF